jgi:glutathione S-transferase
MLRTPDGVISGSWDIARYADEHGSGEKLFPKGSEEVIRAWHDRAETALGAGRALILQAMLDDPEAQEQSLAFLPKALRKAARPMARVGTQFVARKYGSLMRDPSKGEAAMREALLELRSSLAKSSPYLLGQFSYADIIMATSLQGISPADDRFVPLEPAVRRAWTRERLAAEFADLLAWRDQICDAKRPVRRADESAKRPARATLSAAR